MTSSSSSKTQFTRIFYDVFDVGGYADSSRLEVSLLHSVGGRYFDATRRLVSNKLEFARFRAHLQKLWQFWFSLEYTCLRGSGICLVPAVVPLGRSGSTA